MTRWPLIVLLAIGCQSVEMAPPQALNEVAPSDPSDVVFGRRALLSEDAQRALEESRLPALLPADRTLLENAVVTTGAHFVAWSTDTGDGVSVSLHGSDFSWQVSAAPAPAPSIDQVRGIRARVSVNEHIRTVTWEEMGVAWSLDVECADYRDARCGDSQYVRALAESLAAVGGAS